MNSNKRKISDISEFSSDSEPEYKCEYENEFNQLYAQLLKEEAEEAYQASKNAVNIAKKAIDEIYYIHFYTDLIIKDLKYDQLLFSITCEKCNSSENNMPFCNDCDYKLSKCHEPKRWLDFEIVDIEKIKKLI